MLSGRYSYLPTKITVLYIVRIPIKSATDSNVKTTRNSNRNPPVAPTGHLLTVIESKNHVIQRSVSVPNLPVVAICSDLN